MGSFNTALDFTLIHEGRYSDNPNDPGGRTDFGISERSHPEAWSDGKVTREEAEEIYHRLYWTPIHGDELPPSVSLALFDFVVHSPRTLAIQELQKIVWPDNPEEVDGAIGPRTLGQIHELVQDRDEWDDELATRLTRERGLFLGRWIRGRPMKRAQFAPGFFARLIDVTAMGWRI